MSFSGAGVFNINSTGQPVVAGTTISSSTFNALTADLATGLSTCITKDGQQTVTANIPWANYRLTAVGAGTAATDAANVGQVQSRVSGLITVTGTDTLVGTMSPTLGAYATGNQFAFVAANTNTTTVTLNIDGLGAKAVTRDGSTALVAGDITANKAHLVVYDGTRFQLLNSPSFTDLKATTLAVSGATTLSPTSTNGLAITSAGSATSALVITGIASQTGANISTTTPSATTNYWRLGQTGVVNWDIQNVATTGVFQITNGTQTPLTFNGNGFLNIANAGNVAIAAPASGTALLVNNKGGRESGVNVTALAATQNIAFSANGSTTAAVLVQLTNATGITYLGSDSSTGGSLATGSSAYSTVISTSTAAVSIHLATNNTVRQTITSAGNVGIGTASPSQKLTVAVSDTNQALSLQATTGRVRVRPYVDATNGAILESVDVAETSYLPLSFVGSTIRLTTSVGSGVIVLGTAAGTAALRLDTTATTGAQTATWTAPTNKPGAASGVVSKWIPVNLDGTVYYVPAWT